MTGSFLETVKAAVILSRSNIVLKKIAPKLSGPWLASNKSFKHLHSLVSTTTSAVDVVAPIRFLVAKGLYMATIVSNPEIHIALV